MIQKYKELLLKDLCVRLPYGLKVKCEKYPFPVTILYSGNIDEVKFKETGGIENICAIKPYLFPLSSMTEEQKKYIADRWGINEESDFEINSDWGEYIVELGDIIDYIDWLNENHFDYRGLIEKGLAIDATGLNIYW